MAAAEADELAIDVDVDVVAPEAARAALAPAGRLVLSWFTGEEAGRFRDHGVPGAASIVPFVARARVFTLATDRLLAGLALPLRAPRDAGAVFPVAIFDHAQAFWSGFLAGTGAHLAGLSRAPAQQGRAALTLAPPAAARTTTAMGCAGPRLQRVALASDPPASRVCVYLPRSYEREADRRYPVVFMLPGLAGDECVRFGDRVFVDAVDAWSAASGREAILVGVSTKTAYGSVYVTDAGGWARTLTEDVVAAIDAKFRTRRGAAHRVLVGQSSGGWNAICVALLVPGVFGAVAAAAPDALDLEGWLLTPAGALEPHWLAWMRLEDAVQGSGQMLSLAHSFSPRDPHGRAWPADLETGAVHADVLARWLAHSPLRLIERAEAQAALRALEGRLFIQASRHDEFGLYEPAERFSRRLDALAIAHRFMADEGGHFDAQERVAALVTTALEVLRA